MEVQEIPVKDIKMVNRMRKIDDNNVESLMRSIKELDLLHPICVAKQGDEYIILSGGHRWSAFKRLGRHTIPCVVRENNELVNQLVEIEENIVSKKLNAIEESQAIVLREKILLQLGRKAVVGSNQYTEGLITNSELAKQLGITRRVYSYKKQVANINHDAQRKLGSTKYASNVGDMVHLSKQSDEIQNEVADILASGGASTYNRAFLLANLKFSKDNWTEENKQLKTEIEPPKSIMKFGRVKDRLNDLCVSVSHNEKLRLQKRTALFGTNKISNYTMLPEHSRWFVKYFSKVGDVVCDNTCGRGTNLIAAAYEGRKIIGFDLNKDNIDCIRDTVIKHTTLNENEVKLYNSCGVEMNEYKEAAECVDLFMNDIPYIFSTEKYTDDSRDLCNLPKLDDFYERVEVMMTNMKRLIKKSNWEKKIFKPIIMKVGSQRKQDKGLFDMATDIEIIARKLGLVLHDKIYNELKQAMQTYSIKSCFEHRYSMKLQECNLVFLDYE